MTTPIPAPPGFPIIGNLADLDSELPTKTLKHFADIYGPIYRFNFGGGVTKIVISSQEIVEEACNEERFIKVIQGGLNEVRNGVNDGLFTAHHDEKNWGIAHRILMPAFGPLSVQGMFNEMHDIASQLVMKWARHGPDHKIVATDDFTRLTLDTIALCAMDYRFNSFYTDELHPFVGAMGDFLSESGRRSQRPAIANLLMRGSSQKYESDIALMKKVSDEVIKRRKEKPTGKKDLLNAMLNGKDPVTGEGMSNDSIINNMITFLIAGHETTSGMLSFAFYLLIKNSAAYRTAQQEVDDVCGKGPIRVEHISKLKYLNAVLRETLRLHPTAPAFSMCPKPGVEEHPTLCGGKYAVGKNEPIICLLPKVHTDPAVYGEDAEEFKPERMLDEAFEKLPKYAWKPFGNGMRGCIGRAFAWQEALLVVAILLQNFNFQLDDPSYQLKLKQTLTVKPKDFKMRATLRDGIDATMLEKKLQAGSAPTTKDSTLKETLNKPSNLKPMSIFYGSNTGTCEALAARLAKDAIQHGFDAKVEPLDSATDKLPKDQPVVIITASYEGAPPDNAGHFVEWLKSLKEDELKGVQFAVFGCGHRDWQATFQKIPNMVDELIEKRGGERIVNKGTSDAANGNMFTDFDGWEDTQYWPAVEKNYGGTATSPDAVSTPSIEVTVSSQNRSTNLKQDVRGALLMENRLLTAPGEPEKRHVEIRLPTDMVYKAGDYLAILPTNPKNNIRRAVARFGLAWDAVLNIKANGPTVLPTNVGITAADVLSNYVELAQPATKKDILAIAKATADEKTRTALESLAGDLFNVEVSQKRLSPLDILEKYPSVAFTFSEFLAILPPMRVRQYSISSSPLYAPDSCTLTFAVLDQKAISGQGRYVGVASNYLAHLEAGDHVQVSVRASAHPFHLPLDPVSTPLIMVCAGSGLAPFRGFIQERAAQIGAGRKLARALLFVGCRGKGDTLYDEEFKKWSAMGAVDIRYAFSRETEGSEGCKYVQDRLWHDRVDAIELFDEGAKVFVCGSREIGEAVKVICKKMYSEKAAALGKPKSEEEVEEWFSNLRNARYATDVFA